MSKRIFFIVLCLWLAAVAFPLFAQGKSDTVYTFRFVTDRDMFYVPFNGNDAELSRLLECVEQYKPDILNKRVPLHVDGYCTAGESDADNLAMAKVRSNRVKSELIVRGGIKEECFVTKNHSGGGDYVTVRIVIPAVRDDAEEACLAAGHRRTEESEQQRLEQERAAREQAERERAEAARLASEQARADSLAMERAAAGSETETVSPSAEKAEDADSYTLSLRANLLRWATLTPDVGIEWRITPSVGIAVNGSWTSWTWQDNDRRYALWEVAPEVRYYMGKEKRGYLGAMFKAGQFNYKLSGTGRQGDLMGGGITGGYQLRLNKALSLDFNVAVGCLHADYEKYEVIDGVRVRAGKETKNWWGPVNAGVTLVWKLF
ncbi:MAG TPA: DUF3575 domain-containing protein [Candidatus Coprenecus pullicola]|nr:DUF3575 domain-containing protein [Candidatus Coprenecus pullicola]